MMPTMIPRGASRPLLQQQQQQQQVARYAPSPRPLPPPSNAPPPLRPAWGGPTWVFLHVLAERADPYWFDAPHSNLRAEILRIVSLVVHNLPCPDCAAHAREFWRRGESGRMLDRRDRLRRFLCDFHNDVNLRLGRPMMDPQALAAYYAAVPLSTAAQRCLAVFGASGSTGRPAPDALQRNMALRELHTWAATRSSAPEMGYFELARAAAHNSISSSSSSSSASSLGVRTTS